MIKTQEVREELERLYAKRFNRFRSVARRVRVDQQDVEDAIQSAFTKAFQYADSYGGDRAGVEGWVCRIVTNAAREIKKAEVRRGMVSTSEYPDVEAQDVYDMPGVGSGAANEDGLLTETLEDTMENMSVLEAVSAELAKLDDERGRIVHECVVMGHTAKEVADRRRLSHGNVRKIVQRFRENLRERTGYGVVGC